MMTFGSFLPSLGRREVLWSELRLSFATPAWVSLPADDVGSEVEFDYLRV